MILSTLSIIFMFLAYIAKEKFIFLIFNSITIIFIALSFWLSKSYLGFYSESLMIIINLSAFFINEELEKKLKILIVLISFILFSFIYSGFNNLFMPLAMSFFVYGVYSNNLIKLKISFIFGLFFLSLYSYLNSNIDIVYVSIFGIFLNLYSLFKLKFQ